MHPPIPPLDPLLQTRNADLKETNSQVTGTREIDRNTLSQLSLVDIFEEQKKWSINYPKAKAIHYRIGEMIALDNQPFPLCKIKASKG